MKKTIILSIIALAFAFTSAVKADILYLVMLNSLQVLLTKQIQWCENVSGIDQAGLSKW